MSDEETVETMEETVTEEMPTEIVKPLQKEHHTGPVLELIMPRGREMQVDGLPMEVIKVDGMTVTLKRKDIVG